MQNNRGFTLLETLVVLGIIGGIAASIAVYEKNRADKLRVELVAQSIVKEVTGVTDLIGDVVLVNGKYQIDYKVTDNTGKETVEKHDVPELIANIMPLTGGIITANRNYQDSWTQHSIGSPRRANFISDCSNASNKHYNKYYLSCNYPTVLKTGYGSNSDLNFIDIVKKQKDSPSGTIGGTRGNIVFEINPYDINTYVLSEEISKQFAIANAKREKSIDFALAVIRARNPSVIREPSNTIASGLANIKTNIAQINGNNNVRIAVTAAINETTTSPGGSSGGGTSIAMGDKHLCWDTARGVETLCFMKEKVKDSNNNDQEYIALVDKLADGSIHPATLVANIIQLGVDGNMSTIPVSKIYNHGFLHDGGVRSFSSNDLKQYANGQSSQLWEWIKNPCYKGTFSGICGNSVVTRASEYSQLGSIIIDLPTCPVVKNGTSGIQQIEQQLYPEVTAKIINANQGRWIDPNQIERYYGNNRSAQLTDGGFVGKLTTDRVTDRDNDVVRFPLDMFTRIIMDRPGSVQPKAAITTFALTQVNRDPNIPSMPHFDGNGDREWHQAYEYIAKYRINPMDVQIEVTTRCTNNKPLPDTGVYTNENVNDNLRTEWIKFKSYNK